MHRIFNSKAEANAEAAKRKAGYPKAPSHVGWRIAKLVPNTYSPGAVGWETQEGDIKVTKAGKYALSVVADSDGKAVTLSRTEFDGESFKVLEPDSKPKGDAK